MGEADGGVPVASGSGAALEIAPVSPGRLLCRWHQTLPGAGGAGPIVEPVDVVPPDLVYKVRAHCYICAEDMCW